MDLNDDELDDEDVDDIPIQDVFRNTRMELKEFLYILNVYVYCTAC